jgi:hypothetical protein
MNITEVLKKANIDEATYRKEYSRLSGSLVPVKREEETDDSYLTRLLKWEENRDIVHYKIIENYTIRRSGRSTRLTDSYIQELFNDGAIKVYDHHNTPLAHRFLFDNVLRRLSIEHTHIKLEVNRTENKIELIK